MITDVGTNDLVETLPVIVSFATNPFPSIAIRFFSGSTKITLPSPDALVTFSPSRNLFVVSDAVVFLATISVD